MCVCVLCCFLLKEKRVSPPRSSPPKKARMGCTGSKAIREDSQLKQSKRRSTTQQQTIAPPEPTGYYPSVVGIPITNNLTSTTQALPLSSVAQPRYQNSIIVESHPPQTSGGVYTRSYTSHAQREGMAHQDERRVVHQNSTTARGGAPGPGSGITSAFLEQIQVQMERDYILVIDRSGSMAGERWAQAEQAVGMLARGICEFDPDGVTVILFSNIIMKFEHVSDATQVQEMFRANPPQGSTKLAEALDVAFREHFSGQRGETTILVVTDGCPDDKLAAQRTIEQAANSIAYDHELSVSFIQIGEDKVATTYLKKLDDELETRFDIVDAVTAAELVEISFVDLIKKSILD